MYRDQPQIDIQQIIPKDKLEIYINDRLTSKQYKKISEKIESIIYNYLNGNEFNESINLEDNSALNFFKDSIKNGLKRNIKKDEKMNEIQNIILNELYNFKSSF
jgi:hypothetical protein